MCFAYAFNRVTYQKVFHTAFDKDSFYDQYRKQMQIYLVLQSFHTLLGYICWH